METLFLRLLATSESRIISEDTLVRWVLQTNDSEANDCGSVKLSNAAQLIQDRRVVILLPIEQLYIGLVAVQTKNKKQLEKAIPYALEDNLTEDIENLHFAMGPRTENNEVPVTVISKSHLDQIIKTLHDVNILPDIITADIYGLEYIEDSWTLCIENGYVITRTSQWDGFACKLEDFTDFMKIAEAEQDKPASELMVFSHPDENIDEISKLSKAQLDDFWSPSVLVRGFSSAACINLLQGNYAKADKTHKTIHLWKVAAVLAVVWVAISMSHNALEYKRYAKQSEDLAKQVEQVFKRTFPDVKRIVNARVQMEQRIKKLSSSHSQTVNADFLKYLHQSGYELYKNQDVSITDIQYKNNQLSLEIMAKDIQVLESVKSKLQSKQLKAELQTAKSVDDFILARMLVSE